MGMSKSLSVVNFLLLLNDEIEICDLNLQLEQFSMEPGLGMFPAVKRSIGRLKIFLCSYDLISQGGIWFISCC